MYTETFHFIKIFLKHKYATIMLILISSVFLLGLIRIFHETWEPVGSDGFGYYLYLPQMLKYGDISGNMMWKVFDDDQAYVATGRLIPLENGNYINKYPLGVALLMLPFFLIAEFFNIFIQQSDYFGGVYGFWMAISAIFYAFVGLFYLKKTLERFVQTEIVNLTLIIIAFGSNLLMYVVYEPTFSHIYSFAVFSLLIWKVLHFSEKSKLLDYLILGILIGLLITIRQTNIIVLIALLIPIYRIHKTLGLKNFLVANAKNLIICLFAAFFVFSIQMYYWYQVTGHPLFFSYIGETFNFFQPQIFNVLFSVHKGLFFWSPVLLFSIFGFWVMIRKKVKISWILIIILILQLYIVSSWWAWSYGFSFGHRAFTEYLVFFTIPLAFFVDSVIKSNRFHVKFVFLAIILFLCLLNIFQMHQYMRGLINPDGMTWENYKKIFLQPCTSKIEFLRCDFLADQV